MSLFESGFWIPSGLEFGTSFLNSGLNLFDSLIGALICTLFSGIQLCMCRRIFQLHFRLYETKTYTGHRRRRHEVLLIIASVLFAVLFITSAVLYCVQFSRNILVLRSVARASVGSSGAVESLGDDLIRVCLDSGLGCVAVPLALLKQGRSMELAYAGLVQALVFATDMLLVLRCFFIFKDKPLVYLTALLSFLASVGISMFGLASLSITKGLSGASWNWIPATATPALPAGFHPSMSIVSSLTVNAIVSISIISRMLYARKRIQAHRISTGSSLYRANDSQSLKDDVYSSAAALLAESALPPVMFGIIAAVCASTGSALNRGAGVPGGVFEFNIIPKTAWVAFTALAPQLILVRILQGRAWASTDLTSETTSTTLSKDGLVSDSKPATNLSVHYEIKHRRSDSI